MNLLGKINKIKVSEKLTGIFVFTGLLFSLSRLIRDSDKFYVLALISFFLLWILNIKTVFNKKFQHILILFLPFGIWSIVTSLWSLEPTISLTRGLFYIFISSSAVLVGFLFRAKLNELLKLFLILNTIVVSISFLSLVSGIPSDAWTANHGMGFTSIFTHQNTLAAVLMFTLIGPVYFMIENMDLVKSKKAKGKSEKLTAEAVPESENSSCHSELVSESKDSKLLRSESIFSFILIISNLYFIYLSYSRAVMLALFIGGLAFVYLIGTIKFNLIFTLLMIIIGSSIFFTFQTEIAKYLKKSAPDYLGRRMILWEPSYHAALNGGFIGLGYGVTDPTIESNYKKENKFGELKREKGNSILALIEEVGVVGLVLFLLSVGKIATYFFVSTIQNSDLSAEAEFRIQKLRVSLPAAVGDQLSDKSKELRVKSNPSLFTNHSSLSLSHSFLLFSFLLVFFVHSQFEAWFTGISSFYLLIFLIILSNSLHVNYESS